MYDGQSLNQQPTFQNNFPTQVSYSFPGCPFAVVAVGGTAWTVLATTAATRVDPLAANATNTVLVMTGGQQDIVNGDSAATVLASFESYADARRAAGYDRIIATTIPHSTLYTSGQQTIRLAVNAALLLSSHFNGVADVAARAEMQDASNLTYWNADGVHPNAAGAVVMAAVVQPVLAAVFATL